MVKYLICFLAFTGVLFASDEATKSDNQVTLKVGVVDVQKIILNVNEGKSERQKLETEFKAKDKALNKQKDEVKALGEELQNKEKVAMLSEATLRNKQEEFQKKFMKLQQDEVQLRQELKQKEQAATNKIAGKVSSIVEKMAKDMKLHAVFESNSSGLMYLSQPVDLTQEVIKVYDKTPSKKAG